MNLEKRFSPAEAILEGADSRVLEWQIEFPPLKQKGLPEGVLGSSHTAAVSEQVSLPWWAVGCSSLELGRAQYWGISAYDTVPHPVV